VVYTLPTEMTTPSLDLRDYSMLISGEKKVGKTTLMAQFPDTFVMLCEAGGKGLSMYAAPVGSWKAAMGYLGALEKDDAKANPRFKYVAVDTADILARMCEKAVCKRLGIEHPSDEDWGKGWSALKDEFFAFMNRLLALNKGIMLSSHSTEREIKARNGEKHDRIVSTMPKWAAEIIEGLVDMWFHFGYDGQARVLTIRGDEMISAGHRLQTNFRTPDGKEVRRIYMTDVPAVGYRNLLDAFANEYQPPVDDVEDEEEEAPKTTVVKKFKKRA
jgi:hypothetical protein